MADKDIPRYPRIFNLINQDLVALSFFLFMEMFIPMEKNKVVLVCWVLGLGSLVSWNSMLTVRDYYYALFTGKNKVVLVCWVLGLGSLVSWNSMLTIKDYYYALFPELYRKRNGVALSCTSQQWRTLVCQMLGMAKEIRQPSTYLDAASTKHKSVLF